ncbi:MAG: hypothetical protein MRK02_00010 [Candidatus Scalindua sp.]|nr:hypothetical protein [Candidatus Scalindua sp.]
MKGVKQIRIDKGNTCFGYLFFQDFATAFNVFDRNSDRLQGFFNATLSCLLTLSLAVFILAVTAGAIQAKPFSSFSGEEWQYYKGDKDPGPDWKSSDFDASKWKVGSGGFGYGNNRDKVKLNDMKGRYKSVFSRRVINVNNLDAIKKVLLNIDTDGPYVAYINGIKVCENSVRSTGPTDITEFALELLVPGKNVLCVRGSNDDIDSDDFSFRAWLEIEEEKIAD